MTDKDDEHDATHIGRPPPPGARTIQPKKDGDTDSGRARPILPGAKASVEMPATPPQFAPPSPPELPAEDRETVIDDDEERTVIGELASPFSLMRMKPAGHPLPITLTRNSFVIGRSRECDIPLFSQTAHRRHAKLYKRDDVWVLEPFENHVVIADGDLVRGEVEVVHKMRLQLGDDEIVFFDAYKAAAEPRAGQKPKVGQAKAHGEKQGSRLPVVVIAVAVLVAELAVVAWFLWGAQ